MSVSRRNSLTLCEVWCLKSTMGEGFVEDKASMLLFIKFYKSPLGIFQNQIR